MLGELITAGAALAGGFFNRQAAEKQSVSRQIADKMAAAEKYGVSKQVMLGTQVNPGPIASVGDSVASAGQSIGRAASAYESPQGRAGQFAASLAEAQLEGAKLDNEAKRLNIQSQMQTMNQPGNPPGVLDSNTFQVMPGQFNSAGGTGGNQSNLPLGIKLEKKIAPAGYVPQKSFSVSPEIDMYKTVQGYSPEVPQDLGEAHESQPLAAAQWFLRNKLAPWGSEAWRTYPYPAPEGSYWTFDPLFGQYVLVNKGGDKTSSRAHKWEYLMERLRK